MMEFDIDACQFTYLTRLRMGVTARDFPHMKLKKIEGLKRILIKIFFLSV